MVPDRGHEDRVVDKFRRTAGPELLAKIPVFDSRPNPSAEINCQRDNGSFVVGYLDHHCDIADTFVRRPRSRPS
jgi:hypothetical protein